jgi:hypothetical protein
VTRRFVSVCLKNRPLTHASSLPVICGCTLKLTGANEKVLCMLQHSETQGLQSQSFSRLTSRGRGCDWNISIPGSLYHTCTTPTSNEDKRATVTGVNDCGRFWNRVHLLRNDPYCVPFRPWYDRGLLSILRNSPPSQPGNLTINLLVISSPAILPLGWMHANQNRRHR